VTDYTNLVPMANWVERAKKLSPEARFLFNAIVQERWSWANIASDPVESLQNLKQTLDELTGFMDWTYHHILFDTNNDNLVRELRDELIRYSEILNRAIEDSLEDVLPR